MFSFGTPQTVRTAIPKGFTWSADKAKKAKENGVFITITQRPVKGQGKRHFNPDSSWNRGTLSAKGNRKNGQVASYNDVYIDSLPVFQNGAPAGSVTVRVAGNVNDIKQWYSTVFQGELAKMGVTGPTVDELQGYWLAAINVYGRDYYDALVARDQQPEDQRGATVQFTPAQIAVMKTAWETQDPSSAYVKAILLANEDKKRRAAAEQKSVDEGRKVNPGWKTATVQNIAIIGDAARLALKTRKGPGLVSERGGVKVKAEKNLLTTIRRVEESPQTHFLDITNVLGNGTPDPNAAKKTKIMRKGVKGKPDTNVLAHAKYARPINVEGKQIVLASRELDGNKARFWAVFSALGQAGVNFDHNAAQAIIAEIDASLAQRNAAPAGFPGFAQQPQQVQQGPMFGGAQQPQAPVFGGAQQLPFSP